MNLSEMRKAMDEIDSVLLKQFEQRMALSEEIAWYKKANALPVRDALREQEKLDSVISRSAPQNKEAVAVLFRMLFSLSRDRQLQITEGNSPDAPSTHK